MIPTGILREYDIRGIFPEDFSPAVAQAIGRAFGTRVVQAGGRQVVVGRDGRLSSPALESALAKGLYDCGVNVQLIGLGPTPMLYFAAVTSGAAGAIMITGSHNPPNYNGLKMMLDGKPFFGSDIVGLRSVAPADAPSGAPAGSIKRLEVKARYIERLLSETPTGRPLRVIWDCGNGAAGEVVQELVARLPGRHSVLFGEIDGRFPNHHPDPTEAHNMRDLQAAVLEERADFGVAFDGDGDRIGVVDDKGRIIWGDQLLLLLAEGVLREHPGAPIIADVKASRILFEGVAAAGGVPVMHRTGHSLIKNKMREIGAPLAGEMSGHIFFADRWYGFDDALYAALRLLRQMAEEPPGWLAARIDALPAVWNTPEIRLDCPDETKFVVIEALKTQLAGEAVQVNDIDGVRVEDSDGWWLLRASNTQPALVVRCEAKTPDGVEILKAGVRRRLMTLAPSVNVSPLGTGLVDIQRH